MTHFGEIVTILLALTLGMPLPLLPAQLLWLNVVTDGFTGVALAAEERHGDELVAPPRRKGARILTPSLILLTGLTSAAMAIGTAALFRWAQHQDGLDHARSVAFLSMTCFQLWNVFSMRSVRRSIFSLGWFSNRWVLGAVGVSLFLAALTMYLPALQPVFRLGALGPLEWFAALVVSSSVLLVVESYKVFVRKGMIPQEWT
jgi:Ca2+-transporting ATPase